MTSEEILISELKQAISLAARYMKGSAQEFAVTKPGRDVVSKKLRALSHQVAALAIEVAG